MAMTILRGDKINSNDTSKTSDMNSSSSLAEYTITREEQIVQASLMIILAVASLLGNGIVTFIVVTRQKLRSLSNIVLANLASIDLLKSGIIIPLLTSTLITTDDSPLKGSVSCLIVLSFSAFAATVSTLAYVVIAVDRYIAVVHPVFYKQPWKSHFSIRFLFLITPWFVAAIIVFPTYIGTHFHVNIGHKSCSRYRAEFMGNSITTIVALSIFLISLTALILLYLLLFNSLRRLAKRRIQFVSTGNSYRVEERIRAMEVTTAKTTAMTVAAYIFLWLLYTIAALLRYQDFRSVWLDFLSLFFQYTSGVINPFLYFSKIRQFREELVRFCGGKRQRSASMVPLNRRRHSSLTSTRAPTKNIGEGKNSSQYSEEPTKI